ncbi:M50 family metallopeptidase [Corynebacterium sp. ES2794-CONJ1]|uniref:M50 family metallopeptidase n=1 Tax=unclassified Corynebacterium TaxID=2624378 RepID=UPI002168D5B0|nr:MULTISPECIES: M50 family metallopeptidase [unclassified Corynebacterium]MCS4489102.1 M50 family metallopeptidase [Corynebacterium sp. ES2775-CONJ]MCU9518571.1 M50 family metallopeptidase [Corynebacterium sp. ES2794-CONJ1]
MSYIAGVILFALGIALTIALHEWGHYFAARSFHMKVRRYFIGFGPTLFSVHRGHTEYGLKMIPLGGFCEIAGMTNQDEVTAEEAPYAMRNRPWWQRVIVMMGGIAMNLLIAVTILYGIAVSSGLPDPRADVRATVASTGCVAEIQRADGSLSECSGLGPAGEAGIQPGDKIIAANGNPLGNFGELRQYILDKPGKVIELSIERAGEVQDITVQVAAARRITTTGESVTVGAIGISSAPLGYIKRFGPIEAVSATASFTNTAVKETARGLAQFPAKIPGVVASIFGAERAQDGPISVVGASRVGGELVERSLWAMFFMMLASLNLFLAFFNLVPLPPLDGGHIIVVLYEKVRDFFRALRGLAPAGPADYTKLIPVTLFFAGLLTIVGVLVIVADIVNPVRLF